MSELLIPTFEPGQRVLIHNKPVEVKCQGCGNTEVLKPRAGETLEATIIGKTEQMHCILCNTEAPCEGWYTFIDVDGERGCIPYTLLEPITENNG